MPAWHNAPVRSFGLYDAELLIVGLAPGLMGANRTGQAFIGDAAGQLLWQTLIELGFARGSYRSDSAEGVTLLKCLISNAVRCAPPRNKPTQDEIDRCRPFLTATIAAMPDLRAILVLGRIAHDSTLRALGRRLSARPFAHGARHEISDGLVMFDSFHCSRYNTNTGRLTPAMLKSVFESIRLELAKH